MVSKFTHAKLIMSVRVSVRVHDLSTFHGNVDTRCQEQSSEAVVEDLISLQSGCGVVGDLYTCRRSMRGSATSNQGSVPVTRDLFK